MRGLTPGGSRRPQATPPPPPLRAPRPRGSPLTTTTPLCIGRLRTYGNR